MFLASVLLATLAVASAPPSTCLAEYRSLERLVGENPLIAVGTIEQVDESPLDPKRSDEVIEEAIRRLAEDEEE